MSAPNMQMLFCLSGSLTRLAWMPIVSAEGVGSLHNKSIAACWFASFILPRVILRGLWIFSISSTLLIEDPIPPWTQKTYMQFVLSYNTAASGIMSKNSFILEKTELASLMSSPSLTAHSYPKPRYLLTLRSSWLPLNMKICFGYLSFNAINKQITSRL